MASVEATATTLLLHSSDGAEFDMSKMVGLDEDFQGLATHRDIYPRIDPAPLRAAHAFKDKVVLLTGASRGIGAEIARQYARAGATLVLVARSGALLDTLKDSLEKEVPGVRATTAVADVTDTAAAGDIVTRAVDTYGRLDVLVACAGIGRPVGERIGTVDPLQWWNVVEVNLRGVFNFVHFALPHIQKGKGVVVAVSSVVSHYRLPTVSDYNVSKLGVDRLMEFIPIEYPDVRAFGVHPGTVDTDILRGSGLPADETDSPSLCAATILHLSAGKADWLSGRYLSSTWDLGEVERDYKKKILEKNGLVAKLYIPSTRFESLPAY